MTYKTHNMKEDGVWPSKPKKITLTNVIHDTSMDLCHSNPLYECIQFMFNSFMLRMLNMSPLIVNYLKLWNSNYITVHP